MSGTAIDDESKVAPPMDKQETKARAKRKTKRFLWQDDLHQRFVAAIFDLGLKNASPKTLLPLMKASSPESELTTEHLKSHLQKYRINYQRAQNEFKELYEKQVRRSRKRQRRLGPRSMSSPALVFPVRGIKRQKSGNATDSDTDSDVEYAENSSYTGLAPRGPHANAAYGYPVGYLPVHQDSGVIDPQWNTFSMLMSTPLPQAGPLSIQTPNEAPSEAQMLAQEELQMQMHQAMQAQMNYHRQMLTRKVELSHQLFQRSHSMGDLNAQFRRVNTPPGGFEQAWTSTQNVPSQQLVQQFDCSGTQPPLPPSKPQVPITQPVNDSLPTLIATPEVESASSADDDVTSDLDRWDRFNLNVDLDSDDLFDFLKA